MEFTKRTLRSKPGLTQEQALDSLQSAPSFNPGTKIASIRRRGDRWVADLLEPKTAGPFPPKEDDSSDDEAPKPPEDSEGGSSDESSEDPIAELATDGPPKPPGEEGDKKDDEGGGGTEDKILHVLTQILHALSGGAPEGGLGGPDDLGPGAGGPPAPPPHGGPAGGPAGAGGRPMKPGEMPNKPGVVPVGAPAFASTRQGAPSVPPGGAGANPGHVPNPGQLGPGPAAGGSCPECGMPEPCAMHGGGAPGANGPGMSPLAKHIASVAGRASTMVLSAGAGMSVKQAVSEVKPVAAQFGYKIAQVKYVDGKPRVLLTVR